MGSSIVEGVRYYLVNSSKSKKFLFLQKLHEVLGFSNHPVSWNIGQRAVQDIVSLSMTTFLF